MQPTAWKFSNTHTSDFEYDRNLVTTEGLHPCKVLIASYFEDGLKTDKNGEPMSEHYAVTIKFIDGPNKDGGLQDYYWLTDKSGAPDLKGLGILGSLGKAIYGERQDVPPCPDDLMGCVVMANVSFVNGYPHVYHYEPASIQYCDYSDKPDQYFKD